MLDSSVNLDAFSHRISIFPSHIYFALKKSKKAPLSEPNLLFISPTETQPRDFKYLCLFDISNQYRKETIVVVSEHIFSCKGAQTTDYQGKLEFTINHRCGYKQSAVLNYDVKY